MMDFAKILVELRQDRQLIEAAICSLEHLASGRQPRRGRPPKWQLQATGKRRGRPPGSKNKPKVAAPGASALFGDSAFLMAHA